jgi:CHAT domain-containing protein
VRGSSKEDELSANLRELYDPIWAPITQALPTHTRKVIVSPDGQVSFVSFATLLTQDGQFLAEKHNIRYVASGRDLSHEWKPSAVKDVVLFANPAFDLRQVSHLQ